MSVYYDYFYKKNGIRLVSHLMTPPLSDLATLELPRESILHFVSVSPISTGPEPDDLIFKKITKPIMMIHATENGDEKGSPRRLAVNSDIIVKNYHLKNRRFRLVRSIEAATRDPLTLLVVNYGVISHLYKYMRSFYAEYFKWHNTNAAVWKKVAELSKETTRQHFIIYNLPQILPSLFDLKIATSAGMNQKTIKVFNSPEKLFMLEMWKWCGNERADSILNNLPLESLNRVNIILQESGKWFVINLGKLNSWRNATKEELAVNPDGVTDGFDASQLQRRYIRLAMTLFQVKTVGNIDAKDTSVIETELSEQQTPTEVIKQDTTLPEVNQDTGAITLTPTASTLPEDISQQNTSNVIDNKEIIINDEDADKLLEEELAELENISNRNVDNSNKSDSDTELNFDEVPEETENDDLALSEPKTLEEGIMVVCDRLADAGLLSAAEYRRYVKLSEKYKTIKAPKSDETLDKFIVVKPSTLEIKESTKIKDISSVVDKTMLKSSLYDFDTKYIKEIMPKHVAAMVMNLQHAAIAVTDYDVELVEDAIGAYEIYTVRITPVEGMNSTFRFRLPVVNDDGTFRNNSVSYRLRKQRGQLPISKVAPDRVALTSYYGKTFASRSTKKVNDYAHWLRSNIMVKGLNKEDLSITELQPTNVFDSEFRAPRSYSSIALGFRAFTVNYKEHEYSLSFNHFKREELYGKPAIEAYELDGSIIFGECLDLRTKGMGPLGTKILLVMDKNGIVYTANNANLHELTDMDTFLGLDSFKAPVDFVELKVLGVNIPIGIILAYEMGLSKLIKQLKVKPRIVPVGTRVNLEPHEYSLVFNDETLVFSKEDKKATLILAGFNEYHKVIRSYNCHEFDKRGVYLNVIESTGIGVRYIREIDLMYKMFIDPITKDILTLMKEPIDFHGLLIRSCEMLLTDDHPDELDSSYMRIKGYERLAGAVYSEMINAIRSHNSRPGKSKYPIELNPHAVWKNISQDPSVIVVSDINPIENLKESEAVTYAGVGGRTSRSMTKKTRRYHPNDMGTISEATVDSSDVAINTYTSADPQFSSLLGMSKKYEIGVTGATALFSTSALLAPCSDRDEGKRVNT